MLKSFVLRCTIKYFNHVHDFFLHIFHCYKVVEKNDDECKAMNIIIFSGIFVLLSGNTEILSKVVLNINNP
jgi:hypothetical protein